MTSYDNWLDAIAESEFTADESQRRISGKQNSGQNFRSTEIPVEYPVAPVDGLDFKPEVTEIKRPEVLFEEARQQIRTIRKRGYW